VPDEEGFYTVYELYSYVDTWAGNDMHTVPLIAIIMKA